MKILKMLKRYEGWIKGDIARFSDTLADKLLANGYAIESGEIPTPETHRELIPNLPKKRSEFFLCAICGIEFKTKEELDDHKKATHGL